MSTPLPKEGGASFVPVASDLWKVATDSLSVNERRQINASIMGGHGTLTDVTCHFNLSTGRKSQLVNEHPWLILVISYQVLHDVEAKADDCNQKRWKFVRLDSYSLKWPQANFLGT